MTRQSPEVRAARLLARKGIARSGELEEAGISRTQIRRLRERGVIERVARGRYRRPDDPITEGDDLAEASRAVRGGIICLLSALRFHQLTTQNPFEVWIAIGRKSWRPRVAHPPVRLVSLSGRAILEGIEEHEIGGVRVRVFSAAKTVADCFKFRRKIGTDVAVEALRAYRRRHPKGLEALWRYAEVDRVTRVIQPYLDAMQ